MAEDETKNVEIINVILDTNVIISSLVKSEGVTRASLILMLTNPSVKFYIPELVFREIEKHSFEIARKSKIETALLSKALNEILKNVTRVPENEFMDKLELSKKLVKDENDAQFAALALHFSPSIILTFNKKDYRIAALNKAGVKVMLPIEALNFIGISLLSVETKSKTRHGIKRFLTKINALIKKKYSIF